MDEADRGFPPGDFRVSDAERDRAVSELGEAYRVGRITADEFDERSGQALRARTGRELTALLADLPVQFVPAAPPDPDSADRALVVRGVMFASGAVAAVLSLVALGNATLGSSGPTLAQREFARAVAAQQGLPAPQFPPSHFDWAGTITPAAIAVLLVALIIFLHVTRADSSGRRAA